MAKPAPFSEIEDGLPVWRVQVEDPQGALEAPVRVVFKVLDLPMGPVAAAAMELSDVPGRPAYHHQCGAWQHPDLQVWFGLLKKFGRVRLRFERSGWVSDTSRILELDPSVLASLPVAGALAGQAKDADGAVKAYAAFYRAQFPALKSPEAVWKALLDSAAHPVATDGKGGRLKWLLALALLVALAVGAWIFKGGLR